MIMEPNNEWMNDPELQKIDKAKLDFLNKMFVQSTTINSNGNQAEAQKKMMTFLMSLNKLSKDNNISFDSEDVALILKKKKKYATPDDIDKMQKISSFFHSR